MKDGYLETSDIREAIIEMPEDGLVVVGNINCNGHDLRYVKLAYHGNLGKEKVLILELENFVPYFDADKEEKEDED